jgi:hypothetical protein
MCRLNSTELVWATVKSTITETNLTADMLLVTLQSTKGNTAAAAENEEDWKGFCSHVKKVKDT